MPRLGSHLSIAGGLHLALESAAELQCDAVQVFTRNQRQWSPPPLRDEEIAAFRDGLARLDWTDDRLVCHNSYLIRSTLLV